jgi:hypothetical protein
MKALLTVVMALALTPFFANAAEEVKSSDAAAPATSEAAPATSDVKKEDAAK